MDALVQDLRPGDSARVLGFNPGDRGYRQRLLAMGMTPGADFTVTRVAPFGDPVEVAVRGFKLTLRRAEAAVLRVERI
jgi:ferrous iron transport protein A